MESRRAADFHLTPSMKTYLILALVAAALGYLTVGSIWRDEAL
jgi:hypothetical protein